MPIIFEMPSLSPTMEKGNLVSWCKSEGDEIAVGDVIAEIDTDKATMEVESIYKGVLAKILVPAGTHDVAVRQPIAVIRQKGDTDEDVQRAIDGLASAGAGAVAAAPVAEEVGSEQGRAFSAPSVGEDNRVKASPLARRLASEYGVDISLVVGTGSHGRVVKDDVLAAKDAVPLQAPTDMPNGAKFVDEPISSMRRVIAEKLTK
ncbi:MAG: E3 binding domain-containing protein, partial [Alphaproteobacteria bacterium]|nr:E3 binding domain-containing protein [Alphaproteobacteria bacterium]